MMTGKTIPEYFFAVAGEYPQRTLFHYYRDGWQTRSYEAFSAEVSAIALSLMRDGLKQGDRAAIISENRPEWCAAYLAILTAGGIAVPMDPQLGAGEIRNLLADAGAQFLFYSQTTEAAVTAAVKELPNQGQQLYPCSFDLPEYPDRLRTENSGVFPRGSADEIASIIYTSGTTGKPKGVMLTHRNFYSDAAALIDARIVSHEDNVLSVLPLYHTYAFMCTFLVPVLLGSSITYPQSMKGPDLLRAIRERGVSILVGVPQLLGLLRNSIMNKLRDVPGYVSAFLLGLHRLTGFLRERVGINTGRMLFRTVHKAFGKRFSFFTSGGAKLDPQIMRDLEALGFTVLEGYGLTETSPVLTFNPAKKRKPGSAGKPLPTVSIRILNPSPDGEGEIAVKGPMVMKGYYQNPAATAEVLQDGWFRTGDIGRIDRDGYLFITGRSKEVIVLQSGKNIYPDEVEKAYGESPLIQEICVLGIGAEGMAESLHAVIVPDFAYAKQAGISNIHDAVKWEINARAVGLPSYMRVTGYSINKAPLPRTPLGKLRRFLIQPDISRRSPLREETHAGVEGTVADEALQRIVSAIRLVSREQQKILPDDNLELDLGLDSLSKIELVAGLEKAFSLKLPDNFLADIQTVGELHAKLGQRAAQGPAAEGIRAISWKDILAAEPEEKVYFEEPKVLQLAVFLLYALLKLLCRVFFRLEARGIEHIPAGTNYILTPNHTSYLDGFVLILSLPFSYFRNMYLLGLREYFTGAIKGRLARLSHVIPIDSASYLNKALQTSAYVLRNNHSLTVFPEGGRSFDGTLMEFKKGVGILAVETGVAVVPVWIQGAIDALPRQAFWPRPRKITVTFGTPLQAADTDFSHMPPGHDQYQYFANLLRERVLSLR